MEIENVENLLYIISGCKITPLQELEKVPYNKGHDITLWRIIDYCFNYITKRFSNEDEKRRYRDHISHEYIMNVKNLIHEIKKYNIVLYKFIYSNLIEVPKKSFCQSGY